MTSTTSFTRVLGPEDGEKSQWEHVYDRYLVGSADTGGRVSIVEHRIRVGHLAGPVHRHSREDEFSYVLRGRMGALFNGTEVYAEAGDLVAKPRGEWHTFWNAGDEELRILEIITPGGLEELFKQLEATFAEHGPEGLPALAATMGCEVDIESTMALAERMGLTF